MGDRTGIEWTDATWNPIRGCSRVSEGCRNCYAERVAARFSGPGQPYEGLATNFSVSASGPRWTGEVRLVEEHLADPLRWRRPRRVFVNSMSDLFHEKVPDGWIERILAVAALAQGHTFQVLTKRPERMRAFLSTPGRADAIAGAVASECGAEFSRRGPLVVGSDGERLATSTAAGVAEGLSRGWRWPIRNVWLGVSVEDQRTAAERTPLLLSTPAAVRFVSYEPALGPVDWQAHFERHERAEDTSGGSREGYLHSAECPSFCDFGCAGVETLGPLDWLIVGGESGPGARPFDVAWARSTIAACRAAGVACFVKQLGERPTRADCPRCSGRGEAVYAGDTRRGHRRWETRRCSDCFPELRDRKGGDPAEWPEDLRVREFPAAAATGATR